MDYKTVDPVQTTAVATLTFMMDGQTILTPNTKNHKHKQAKNKSGILYEEESISRDAVLVQGVKSNHYWL